MIHIVDYDPQWPLLFDDLNSALADALGALVVAIEHVGSTAVPGLAAKPIIDLDLVIEAEERLPAVIGRLSDLGYVHQGNLGIAGREAFDRMAEDVPRNDVILNGTGRIWPNHHLYVCPQDSRELARHLAFRDYLRPVVKFFQRPLWCPPPVLSLLLRSSLYLCVILFGLAFWIFVLLVFVGVSSR